MFKQFLQAGALQFVQIDSCRLGSVNENLAVLLMAHKFQGCTSFDCNSQKISRTNVFLQLYLYKSMFRYNSLLDYK